MVRQKHGILAVRKLKVTEINLFSDDAYDFQSWPISTEDARASGTLIASVIFIGGGGFLSCL